MRNLLLCIFSLLVSLSVFAEPQSLSKPCADVKLPSDLLKCIVRNGSEIQKEKANVEELSHQVRSARQFTNPELGVESVGNTNNGRDTEVTLLFPIEIGRRGARIRVAEANSEIAKRQLLSRKEEVAISVVTSLYRLRQIDSEIELLKESAETFHGINKSYKDRLKLNPEQEVALSVFEIASEENELRLTKLTEERDRISASAAYDLGGPITPELLPPIKTEWEALKISATQSSALALAEAETKRAEAELSLAKSEVWPDLRLGPKFDFISGSQKETQVGFALSMSLPVLNQNGGAKEAAKYRLLRANLETNITRTKINTERELLLKTYERSAAAIKHANSTTRLSERHKSLHHLLKQGVISPSLVIELHRQLFDYQSALHEQELSGIEALWKLYALDGSIAEANQ